MTGEPITDKQPAVKMEYTTGERVHHFLEVSSAYIQHLQGLPTVVSRETAHWYFFETHSPGGAGSFTQFIANHSSENVREVDTGEVAAYDPTRT